LKEYEALVGELNKEMKTGEQVSIQKLSDPTKKQQQPSNSQDSQNKFNKICAEIEETNKQIIMEQLN
jgi:hypothetical protein